MAAQPTQPSHRLPEFFISRCCDMNFMNCSEASGFTGLLYTEDHGAITLVIKKAKDYPFTLLTKFWAWPRFSNRKIWLLLVLNFTLVVGEEGDGK